MFLAILNNFFIIPVVKENPKIKLPLATGVPITFAKEIKFIPLLANKLIKVLPKQSKAATYLLTFLVVIFFFLELI